MEIPKNIKVGQIWYEPETDVLGLVDRVFPANDGLVVCIGTTMPNKNVEWFFWVFPGTWPEHAVLVGEL